MEKFSIKWCMVCGRGEGYCDHGKKTTEDEDMALRIKSIYKGLELDKGNRTHK